MPRLMLRAFTLIELLVVITIIVVLLALLVPSLDRAIYEAEMAVCQTNLRGVSVCAFQYTADHKRRYPHKPAVDAGKAATASELNPVLLNHGGEAEGGYDVRPIIRDYFDINGLMNCPLIAAVDLIATESYTNVYCNYAQFYGWRYKNGPVWEKGMIKLGDRFEYLGEPFEVLGADWEAMYDGRWTQSAHPDGEGILAPESLENETYEELQGTGLGSTYYTISYYIAGGSYRGSVDRNFVFSDGSVERWNDLRQKQSNPVDMEDERLAPIPTRSNNVDAAVNRIWVPKP